MFWVWILILVLAIVGVSVLVGRSLSKPPPRGEPMSRHERMTALKASGALRHRKSNRN
jgi:hypothetical protein